MHEVRRDPLFNEPEDKRQRVRADLEHRFTYQSPKPGQPERYREITDRFLALVLRLEELCPDSRERSTAFTLLQQARMMANAAIACNE